MKLLKNSINYLFLMIVLLSVQTVNAYCTEHQHTFSELYTVKPTCTENGYTVYSCDCGESYECDTTNALGHNFSEEIVCFKKSSCIEKGEGGRYCKRCFAKTDTVYYDKTTHTPVKITVKATVASDGYRIKECSICKKLYSKRTISKISSLKLEKKTYTYDRKVKKPSLVIKDSKGEKLKVNKDYTLKYQKGRKKTGIYSVTVTFMGNYEGEKTLYFKIAPTAVRNLTAAPSLSSVYLSWDKSKGATGYEVYLKGKKTQLLKETENLYCTVSKINGKKLKSGADYVFIVKSYKKTGDRKVYSSEKKIKFSTKPQKARIKKIALLKGKATVTAVKQNCHGYEFLISTNKSFSNAKTIKLKGNNKTACSFNNLIKGKKYYFKVRAYVVSGGEKYYGYYSEVKTFIG